MLEPVDATNMVGKITACKKNVKNYLAFFPLLQDLGNPAAYLKAAGRFGTMVLIGKRLIRAVGSQPKD